MDDSEYKDYTAVLRIASGQETETDFVLIEHAYCKPLNWNPGLSTGRPRKTLFISRVTKDPVYVNDDEIDIVTVNQVSAPVPYDIDKAKHVMNECERHVRGISQAGGDLSDEDDVADTQIWEEKVDRTLWSETQHEIFESVVKVLDSHHLARLALSGTPNEPVKRRAVVDKAASKFRRLFAKISWDHKLTQWLHGCLLQNLTPSYLAAYIDVLQTLKSKIPTLVDKMIDLAVLPKSPRVDALNLLLKRPWDPALPSLNQSKPKKLEKMPIIIIVPSGASSPNLPQASRRTRFFNTQLQHLAKSIPVNVTTTAELSDAKSILDCILREVRTKIVDCRRQFAGQPIVLLGWGIGAILAAMVSLNEKVDALALLGFPMQSHIGKRGEADDILLEVMTPSLFIIGSKALNTSIDDVEDFRHRLKATTSLVVISDAEATLKISNKKQYWEGLTQSMVDRCIVDEIGDFLTSVLCDEAQNPVATAQMTNLVVEPMPVANRKPKSIRDASKKRKISPLSIDNSFRMPSGVFRAGTNLSQHLGLKIPFGTSAGSARQSSGAGKSHSTDGQIDSEVIASSKKSDVSSSFLGNLLLNPPSKASSRSPNSVPKVPSTSSVTTISIGGLASVSKQRYQSLFQATEEGHEDTDGGRKEFARPPQTTAPHTTSNKRGRPPSKNKGVASDPKPIKHYGRGRPPGRNKLGAGNVAEKTKVSLATDDDTSMAVLTFTGGAIDGEGQDKIEGLSTVGRGFLTLARGGGTSSVRVFSTSSAKLASQKANVDVESSPVIKINSGTSVAGISSGNVDLQLSSEATKVPFVSNLLCPEKGTDAKVISSKMSPNSQPSLTSLPQISVGQMPAGFRTITQARVGHTSKAYIPKFTSSEKSAVMLVTSSSSIPLLSSSIGSKATVNSEAINKDTQQVALNQPKFDPNPSLSIDQPPTVESSSQVVQKLRGEKIKDVLHKSNEGTLQPRQLKTRTFGRKSDSLQVVTSRLSTIQNKPDSKPIVVSPKAGSAFSNLISTSNQKIAFAKLVKSSGVKLSSQNASPSQPIKLSMKDLASDRTVFAAPLKKNFDEHKCSSSMTSGNQVVADVRSVHQPITQSGIVTKKVVISKKMFKELMQSASENLGSQSKGAVPDTNPMVGPKLSPAEELNLVLEQTADALCSTMDTDVEPRKISARSVSKSTSVESSAKRRLSEIKVSITTPTKSPAPIEVQKITESTSPTIVAQNIDDEASNSGKTTLKPQQKVSAKEDAVSRITRSSAKMAGSTRRGSQYRSSL